MDLKKSLQIVNENLPPLLNLELGVLEARGLSDQHEYFATITKENVSTEKTTVQKSKHPRWYQIFEFLQIDPVVSDIIVSLCEIQGHSEATIIGTIHVPLLELFRFSPLNDSANAMDEPIHMVEQWFKMIDNNGSELKHGEIHLRFKFYASNVPPLIDLPISEDLNSDMTSPVEDSKEPITRQTRGASISQLAQTLTVFNDLTKLERLVLSLKEEASNLHEERQRLLKQHGPVSKEIATVDSLIEFVEKKYKDLERYLTKKPESEPLKISQIPASSMESPSSSEDEQPVRRTQSDRDFRAKPITKDELKRMIKEVFLPNKQKQQQATTMLLKMINSEKTCDAFCAEGGLPLLISYLYRDMYKIEVDSIMISMTWALLHVSHKEKMRSVFHDYGGAPLLVKLLHHHAVEVQEQCAWFIATVCDNEVHQNKQEMLIFKDDLCDNFREIFRKQGVFVPLIKMLYSSHTNIQLQTLHALVNMSLDRANRKAICDLGGVSCIINLLSSNEENIRVLAAWALSNVSADEAQTISTCRDVGIPLLINMMEYSTSGIQQAKAASCVANLCMLDANKDLILKLRGILPVVHCLSAKEPKIKAEAARTVSLLAQHARMRSAFTDTKVIPRLIALLQEKKLEVVEHACWALAILALDPTHREDIFSMNGLQGIVQCLANEGVQEPAVWCLARLSQDETGRTTLIPASGAIEGLVKLLFSEDPSLRVPAAVTLSNLKSSEVNCETIKINYEKLKASYKQ